jgi:hypothetical protein
MKTKYYHILSSRLRGCTQQECGHLSRNQNRVPITQNSYFILALVIFTLSASCKKFVVIPNSKSQISTAAVFADSTNATAAVLGIYINMMNGTNISTPFNGQVTLYTALSSDELYTTGSSTGDLQFYENALNNNSNSQYFWDNGYTLIYQANAAIEGLTASNGLTTSAKNQLLGECKLARAINYFHLVNLFGPVPLIINTDYKTNGSLPRASVAAIYAQIITDLTEAESSMSASYVTSGKVRPNKYTATALLAKVYLYQKQWAKAETEASAIINSGVYSLNADLNGVFLANSNEAIWQLLPLYQGYETPEGASFVPSAPGTIPTYVISNYLLSAFESGDKRKSNWLDTTTVSGQIYYYPYKYKLGYDGSSTPSENYMVFRLGEQYLIRAEARAEQNEQGNAIADLNIIRNRAGLANTTANDQTTLLSAIQHERQVELFCEWGNRWYDLKRTGTANSIMPAICQVKGGSWSTNWQLYPVPYTELQLNPYLSQNSGY